MIYAGTAILVYLVIGAVVSFEAHRHDWNSRLTSYEQGSNLGWFLFWWWYGAMIFFQNAGDWWFRFGLWFEDATDSLFERISERWHDETDS